MSGGNLMEFFGKTNIDFIKKMKAALLVSVLLIIASIVSLVVKGGPNLGIDFTGGALIQLKFDKLIRIEEIRTILNQGNFSNAEIQNFPKDNVIVIRLKKSQTPAEDIFKEVKQLIQTKLPDNSFIVEQNEMVSPVVSKDLIRKALSAIIFSFLGILIYVNLRFKKGIWGLAGIIALIHDVFLTIGFFSFLNREITLPVVAALLTLAGYSINDTIVIYDRIRENLRLKRGESLYQIVNGSINETLSRTIITSGVTFLVVMALFFKGGEVIHDFSLALLIGMILGTYSTIFIASPIVYERMSKKPNRRY